MPEIQRLLDSPVERSGSAVIGVAGVEGGEIAWSSAAGGGDASAVFQAGSLSKTVTAAVVLELVRRGVLDLDSNVNERLSSWALPSGTGASLRQLLGHTAGVNVPFCPGYPGHVDGERIDGLREAVESHRHDPLDLPGELIRLDTSAPVDVAAVADRIANAAAVPSYPQRHG